MNGNPRLVAYLQRAVNHEFTAAQQFVLQTVRAEALGMQSLAEELRGSAREELCHAEAFLRSLVALGITPRAGQTVSPPVGRSQVELLRFGLATEAAAIALYEEAALFCARLGDERHRALFERILADEVRHCEELERKLTALGVEADTLPARRRGGDGFGRRKAACSTR